MFTFTSTTARSLAIAAGLALPSLAHADVFQRALGDADRETAYAIEQTDDGGYITTGFRDNGPAASPNEDVLITKHFADGTIEWQRQWAGPGRDIGYAVQQTFDGGYIVAAESTSSGDPAVETLLIRLDAFGNPVWQNFYFGSFQGDPIHAVHPGVALDQGFNGQIYVTGNILGRPMVLNVGPGGVPIWNAVYADPLPPSIAARFAFTDIKHDPTNSTLVVSGTTLRNEPTPPSGVVLETQDAFLLRLDGAGAPIWIWNYDFPFDLDPTDEPGENVRETGDGLDIAPSGRIILNGRTDFGAAGSENGTHLVSVDPNGFPTWSREYRYIDPAGIVSFVEPAYAAVRFDNNGDIIQAGTNRAIGGFSTAVEWKTNFGGAPAWFYAYGGPNNTAGQSVIPDANCGYAMAGQITFPPPAPPFARGETYLVKNDDDGLTGCAEVPWSVAPDFNAVPKQNGIVPDYVMKVLPAPNLLVSPNSFDNALCYSSGCGTPPCPCDINGDGVLDLSDVSAFVACFTGSLPCGDIAPPFGVWDIGDIGLFISCFLGGC